jgi:hypothetical protein
MIAARKPIGPCVEGGDSIDLPNTSAQAATGDTTPPADVIDIDQHRHAGD